MNGCRCAAAYIGAERICLRNAIAENRSVLSEQLNRDIDDRVATQDFIDNLIDVFSRQFNLNFCRACPFQNKCGVKLCPAETH